MPYVKAEVRKFYDPIIKELEYKIPGDAGDINFLCTEVIKAYLKHTPEKYENYNAAIGALEACKLELYRRMVAPYEDTKIALNGDVYP